MAAINKAYPLGSHWSLLGYPTSYDLCGPVYRSFKLIGPDGSNTLIQHPRATIPDSSGADQGRTKHLHSIGGIYKGSTQQQADGSV